MVLPPTKPLPERLKPLRAVYEQQPGVVDELIELLDWSQDEVQALLSGEVEPSREDMWIINGLLKHIQNTAETSKPQFLAA